MQVEIDQTRWYDRIWAAFIIYTRLPFRLLHEPPKECYRTVVEHWPLTGWLTGGVTALTLCVGSMYLPYVVAVVQAIMVRLLVSGSQHEVQLAHFLDGIGGGGTDRERILAVMKDSHIGTYGVLGLIVYHLLLAVAFYMMAPDMAALAIVAITPYARMVAAQLVVMMPYASREDEVRGRSAYRKFDWKVGVSLAVQGLLPMAVFLWLTGCSWELVVFLPCIMMYFLYLLIWNRLHGYTTECLSAVCLLVELMGYVVVHSA